MTDNDLEQIQNGNDSLKTIIARANDIDLRIQGAAEVSQRIIKEALDKAREIGKLSKKVAETASRSAEEAVKQADKALQALQSDSAANAKVFEQARQKAEEAATKALLSVENSQKT